MDQSVDFLRLCQDIEQQERKKERKIPLNYLTTYRFLPSILFLYFTQNHKISFCHLFVGTN